MKIIVKPHDIEIQKTEKVNENEYNITKCEFEFSEEYTDDLVKVALFTNSVGTYKQIIFNNECNIPAETLEVQEPCILGVYAYKEENEELILRYSPEPIKFYISKGSYKENAENSEPITPTDKEQIEQAIVDLDNNKQDKLIAGDNITIEDNVISAVDTIYDDSEIREDIQELENDKVDKIQGKGLSTNDYTNEEKSKLASLENYDDTEVKADIANLQTNKADKSELPDVSNFVTKDVNDLTNYTTTSDMNSAISNAVGVETTNRQNADINLQGQIDAITSASDVVDVVSTYTDLQNYDTTKLTDKDVLKVMQDNTHNNAISYYRWTVSGSIGSWVYVGSEGPFYTKGETDTLLADKLEESDLIDYVKNTDYAKDKTGGVVKVGGFGGANTQSSTGVLYASSKTYQEYQNGSNNLFIGKGTLENVITGKGLVSNTDYATSSAAGVIKTGYGSELNENGILKSIVYPYSEYTSMPTSRFISKGTLENVISGKELVNQTTLDNSQTVQNEQINYLDNVVEQLPKIIAAGTDITLNDTIEAKLKVGVKGNTEQDTYEGKNLISISDGTYTGNNGYTAVVSDGKVVVNGTGTSSPSVIEIPLDYPITIPAGSSYVVRLSAFNPVAQGNTTEGGNYFSLRIGTATNSNALSAILGNVNATASASFGVDSVITKIQIRGYQGSSFNNFVLYPQLELNSNIGHFEPYVGGIPSPSPDYPQDIKVVTGNNTIKIEGKNIWGGFANSFSKTNGSIDFVTNTDGTITANGTASVDTYSMFSSEATNNGFLKTLPAGTYTVSGATPDIKINVVKGDGTGLVSTSSSSSATFTLTEETQVFIRLQILQGKSANNVTIKPMLERGPNVTSYETYKATTYPLNLGNIELCKLGNYQDYFYKDEDKWYLYKTVDKKTYTGSQAEGWFKYSTNTFSSGKISSVRKSLCDYYEFKEEKTTATSLLDGEYCYASSTNNYAILIKNSNYDDANSFKTWLSTHNITIYYVVETPTTTEITDTTLIGQLNAIEEAISYANQTNLSSTYESGNAPIYLSVEAFSDIEKELDSKVSDVQVNGTSVTSNGIANIPVASTTVLGVVKAYPNLGTSISSNAMVIEGAISQAIKNPASYSSWRRPILPTNQHEATFYGLAKASGDSTQSASANEVGTYTPEAKTKIMNMLGDKYELISTDVLTENKTVYTKTINGYENIMVTIDRETAFASSSYMTINIALQNDTTNYRIADGYGVSGKMFVTGEWERKSNDMAKVTFFTHSASGLVNRRNVTSGGITQVQIAMTNDNLPSGTTIKIYGKGKV